jgi:signal transduction histidine kinase
MRRIGLRQFFFSVMTGGAVTVLIVSSVLWQASDRLRYTASFMQDTIEGMMLVQSISSGLEAHRRQALLSQLEDSDRRNQRRSQEEKIILEDLDKFEHFIDSNEERVVAASVRRNIETYFSEVRTLQAVGSRGADLFRQTSEPYGLATSSVSDLFKINVVQTLAVERSALQQGLWFKAGVIFSFFIMLMAIGGMFTLFRRVIYRPLLELRQTIANFSNSGVTALPVNSAVREVYEIGETFRGLSASLQRQNEQRMIFMAAVAHDLKNPLGAIEMSIDLLSQEPMDSADPELLAVIHRQVGQLRRLVDDIMDATRIEAGHLELRKSKSDLRDIVQDSVRLFSSVSELHRIDCSLPPDYVWAECDSQRLSQVLNNLMSNAIKYSPKGGSVIVRLAVVNKLAIISVKDNGVGMETEEQERVFEPFRRAKSSRDLIAGVGLGLSTARKIVEAHGGSIEVESTKDIGSTFRVVLPIIILTQSSLQQERSTEPPALLN